MNATQETIRDQSQKDPAELEREIEQQRRHIEGIVQALENKLSPGEIFDRVLSFGKGTGRDFAGNLTNTVKENPVPALLTAAGLLWLYASSRQSSSVTSTSLVVVDAEMMDDDETFESHSGSNGIGERLHSAKSAIGDKAHGAASSIRSGAQGAKQSIRSGARTAKESIRSGARTAKDSVSSGVHRAKEGYGTMLQENPLAAGAIAVAVGAVLGALMPPTRKEDEVFGEASDRLGDRLKAKAREQKDRLSEEADQMTQPRQGQEGGSSVGDVSASARSPTGASASNASSTSATSDPYGGAGRAH